MPHRITSSFLPRSQRDQTERLEFRSCLENLREKGKEKGGGGVSRGKNGMTSGFEWLRKLPWYPPINVSAILYILLFRGIDWRDAIDESRRTKYRTCIFVCNVYRHLSIVIIEKHKETWYFNERCSIFRRITSNSGCKQRCASIDSRNALIRQSVPK